MSYKLLNDYFFEKKLSTVPIKNVKQCFFVKKSATKPINLKGRPIVAHFCYKKKFSGTCDFFNYLTIFQTPVLSFYQKTFFKHF